jgi:hypothetical protein
MKKIAVYSFIALLAANTSGALAQGNLGQAGANFLQIGVEPRGAALGGAVSAISEGAAALYWNPAGIISSRNIDLYLANTNWCLDTRLFYGGITKKLGGAGVVGLAVTSFYMDPMEITTEYASEGNGQYYDAGDLAVGFSFARSLTDRFTFGITAKFVREYIWHEEASQLAFDVGSVYRTDFYNLRLGMVVRNFAGKLRFSGEDLEQRIADEEAHNQPQNPRIERLTPDFRLPQVFQMGIAFDPLLSDMSRLTLLADVDVPSDNEQRLILGAEYGFKQLAYLRAAYRLNDDVGDFSIGGGLNLTAGGLDAILDYSYSGQGALGNMHRFGFGFSL